MLLEAGAGAGMTFEYDGMTPLAYTAENVDQRLVQMLLYAGAA